MKKLTICMLMFLFLLSFSGCSAAPPQKINMHIDSPYTAQMGDMELSGLLIYTDEGQMYLDVSTPDELCGLSFSYKEDFIIGYNGLNAVTENDYLPKSSFAQSIKNSLDDARLEEPTLQKTAEKKYAATGKSSNGAYRIHTDELGNIEKIEVSSADVKMKIEN